MINNKDSTDQSLIRTPILLGIVLFVALALRLVGIHHGLPYGYQIDEKIIVNHAMGFGTGDLNPHFFQWPGTPLMYLLFLEYGLFFVGGWGLGFFPTPESFAGFYILHPSAFYLIGRITIALIGTATVFLTYRLGKKMYSARPALLAAVFVASSYLAVGIDHFIFTDTPLTFVCVLSMLSFYLILTQGKMSRYIWSGLFIGMAAAIKYSGAALLIPLSLAHAFRLHDERKKWFLAFSDKRILTALFVAAVGFVLCCPFSVLDFSTFSKDVSWQFSRVHSGSFGSDVENAWQYYLFHGLPFSVGVGLTVISLVAVLSVIVGHQKKEMLVAAFVLFYLIYISSWKVGVDKYLLPIIPFLALLAGHLIDRFFSAFGTLRPFAKRLPVLCALLLISEPLVRVVHNDYLLTRKDTRTEAKEWIEENIPAGARIAIDAGNFDVAKFSPPLDDSRESLEAQDRQLGQDPPQVWASSADKIRQYLQIKMKYQSAKGYNLIHIVHNFDGTIDRNVSLETLIKKGVDYIVVSSYVYQVLEDPIFQDRYPDSAKFYRDFYSSVDKRCHPVKTFYPISKEGPGPIIRIYRVPR